MKFLVDMNLSPEWVGFLIKSGQNAIHWSDVGSGDASDVEVMRWAADHDCVVLTNDLDFGAILAATHRQKPSVIQVRSGVLTPHIIGPAVLAAIQQSAEELEAGALISVDVGRSRLRVLPLRN